MRRILLVAAVAVLGVFAPFLVAAPASAADETTPGAVQGFPLSVFGTIPAPVTHNSTTGWDSSLLSGQAGPGKAVNFFTPEGAWNWDETLDPERAFMRPVIRFGEPYRSGSTLRFDTVWHFENIVTRPLNSTIVLTGRSPQYVPASVYSVPNYLYCSTTEWALPSQITKIESTYLASGSPSVPLNNTQWPLARNNVMMSVPSALSACPFLHRMEFTVGYNTGGLGSSQPLIKEKFVWKAQQARDNFTSVLGDPREYICNDPEAFDIYEECKFINKGADGSNFAHVCGAAPSAEWLSWDWLPGWVGYYARCLFTPINGFDRTGSVADTWAGAPLAAVVGSVETAVESFRIAPSCGTLIEVPAGVMGDAFSMSTCGWSAWSEPVKIGLGVLVSVQFALWAIGFLTGTLSGIPNKRTPSPVAGGSEE